MADQVLRCEGMRKQFGERIAVDGVGFSIAAGETYGLLGPNGAGKTTTISMICGLLSADAGEVEAQHRRRPAAPAGAAGARRAHRRRRPPEPQRHPPERRRSRPPGHGIGIIDEGKSVAEGTRAELVDLLGESDHVHFSATGRLDALADNYRNMAGVEQAQAVDGPVDLLLHGARRLLPSLFKHAEDLGVTVQSVDIDEPTLETVLHLTGRR